MVELVNKHSNLSLFPYFLISLFFYALPSFSQDLGTDTVTVLNPYRITTAEAVKISSTPDPDTSVFRPAAFTYGINSKRVNTVFSATPVVPVKIKDEPIKKLYKIYTQLGYGTYNTPYAEFNFNSLRSRDFSIGTHFRHISSTGKIKNAGYSGFSQNDLDLYARKFFEKHTLSGGLNYNRNLFHYYGYDALLFKDISKDSIDQSLNLIGGQVEFGSTYLTKLRFDHKFNASYHNLTDRYGIIEDHVVIGFKGGKNFRDKYFGLDAGGDINSTQLSSVGNRALRIVHLKPFFSTDQVDSSGYGWHLKAGLKMLIADTSRAEYHVYPQVYFSWDLVENFLILYARFTGDTRSNTYKTLSDNNPFLNPIALNEQFTHVKKEAGGGFKGTLSNNISFDIGVFYSEVDSMPFYVNELWSPLKNKFNVIYDDVSVINVHGELGFYNTEKLRLNLTGDYFNYTMLQELKPWHTPTVRAMLTGKYSIGNKIVLKGEVYVSGSQFAKTYFPIAAKKLKGVTDVNLGIEYRYTKLMSLFLNFNNIGNVKYHRWDGYPTQRFNLLGGLTYALWP